MKRPETVPRGAANGSGVDAIADAGPASSGVREKARCFSSNGLAMNNPGSDLLSHAVTHAVPSAVASLTSVFGMGTGVTLLL